MNPLTSATIFSVVLSLTGCQSWVVAPGGGNVLRLPAGYTQEKAVELNVLKEDELQRAKCAPMINQGKLLGCAFWTYDGKKCQIYVTEGTSQEVLGHELRHCYEGAFHP